MSVCLYLKVGGVELLGCLLDELSHCNAVLTLTAFRSRCFTFFCLIVLVIRRGVLAMAQQKIDRPDMAKLNVRSLNALQSQLLLEIIC